MRKTAKLVLVIGILAIVLGALLYVKTEADERKALEEARAGSEALSRLIEELEPADEEKFSFEGYEEVLVEMDGAAYLGELIFPERDLRFAVAAELSDALLDKGPCRQSGSLKGRDLIIAGHNYKAHFLFFREVREGESIVFIDGQGREFELTVAQIEKIAGSDVEAMEEGDWDVTLFTCVYGNNKQRTALRCVFTEEYN